MTDAATEKKSPSKLKATLMKLVSAASFISLGWMGPGLVDQFTGPAPQDAGAEVATPAVIGAKPGQAAALSDAETQGLLLMGASYGAQLQNMQDPRDLCRAIKTNAVLSGQGQKNYSAEFESCATRDLHYDAALLQEGALLGLAGLHAADQGDYCALKRVAAMRAEMKNALEFGKELATHDETLQSLNEIFTACQSAGEFKIDNQSWNNVANQMVLLPFYQKAPAAP